MFSPLSHPRLRSLITLAVLAGAASSALGQCPPIDFENLPVGTYVTNQYPGVTFSEIYLDGSSSPPIIDAPLYTSSGTRALRTQGDFDDFSPWYIRMDFTHPQTSVSFNTGTKLGCGTSDRIRIRTFSGGAPVVQDIPIYGISVLGVVSTHVHLVAPPFSPGITRIEVEYGVSPSCYGGHEFIDDLEFQRDPTPPVARFDSPSINSCICGPISFFGISDDPEGYDHDELWMSRDLLTWTRLATSPFPQPGGFLYPFTPAPTDNGEFFFRLDVYNQCGGVSQAFHRLYVDHSPPSVSLRYPLPSTIIGGGAICFDGTIDDFCSLSNYTIQFAPLPADAPYRNIDGTRPVYTSIVYNDPFATWDSRPGQPTGAPDGPYRLRIIATDTCGQPTILTRDIVLDNTPPVAQITSPLPCTNVDGLVQIRGTATDAHLGSWVLQYTGDAHTWTTIAAGTSNVTNALLAVWDTRGFRHCPYALRLVVTDTANLNCGAGGHVSESYIVVDVGCAADFNRNGVLNSGDFFDFLAAFFAGCP